MTCHDLTAEARGDIIMVIEPASSFFAIYAKEPGTPQLKLKSRAPGTAAWQAKARKLGWIA
jgi:hypothetical protein